MKVACIGNMNNMMFTLCRYLRDRQIDAYLFVFENEPIHFSPESDSYNDSYKEFTVNLSINFETFFNTTKVREVDEILAGFDFYIGTDYAPALMFLLGKKLDLFMPHGSDIYSIPFNLKRKKGVDEIWWKKSLYFSGVLQKKGIFHTDTILFPDEYDKNFNFKKKLKFKGNFIDGAGPMLYVPQYNFYSKTTEELKYSKQFEEIRQSNELMLFSHSRHNGTELPKELSLHLKGNDLIIKAVARFVESNPGVKIKLVLFDYGMNVDFSKKMVVDLGLENVVEWMPKMDRKEILYGLSLCDVAFGQFVNSWLTCGVVNEVLANGKPLIHYLDLKMYDSTAQELYYFQCAKNEFEIYECLNEYGLNTNEIIKRSGDNKVWLEKNTVEKPISIILGLIRGSKLTGKREVNSKLFCLITRFKIIWSIQKYRLFNFLN